MTLRTPGPPASLPERVSYPQSDLLDRLACALHLEASHSEFRRVMCVCFEDATLLASNYDWGRSWERLLHRIAEDSRLQSDLGRIVGPQKWVRTELALRAFTVSVSTLSEAHRGSTVGVAVLRSALLVCAFLQARPISRQALAMLIWALKSNDAAKLLHELASPETCGQVRSQIDAISKSSHRESLLKLMVWLDDAQSKFSLGASIARLESVAGLGFESAADAPLQSAPRREALEVKDVDEAGRKSPSLISNQLRAQALASARANAGFPFARDALSPDEVLALMNSIRASGLSHPTMTVLLTLFLGILPGNWNRVAIVRSSNEHPRDLAINVARGAISVPFSALADVKVPADQAVGPLLSVALPAIVADRLCEHTTHRPQASSLEELLGQNREKLHSEARKWLSKHSPTLHRATLSRLAGSLAPFMVRRCGTDPLLAAICARDFRLSTRSHLNYVQVSEAEIFRAIEKTHNVLGLYPIKGPDSRNELALWKEDSRQILESVRLELGELHSAYRRAGKRAPFEQTRTLHNQATRIIARAIWATCGLRVSAPLSHARNSFCFSRGLLQVADKESNDFHQSRLVVLPTKILGWVAWYIHTLQFQRTNQLNANRRQPEGVVGEALFLRILEGDGSARELSWRADFADQLGRLQDRNGARRQVNRALWSACSVRFAEIQLGRGLDGHEILGVRSLESPDSVFHRLREQLDLALDDFIPEPPKLPKRNQMILLTSAKDDRETDKQ